MIRADLSLEKVVSSLPWYERAIEAIAPTYANRRLQARVQRHLFRYQAAETDRIYTPKRWGVPSENQQTARDRITMGWEARDLVENFTYAKAAIRTFSKFLTPTEYAPATGDRDYDMLVADSFHDWCKGCDVRGIHAFSEIVQLAVEMRPVWGDCGVAIRRIKKQIKLDLIDGVRIGNPGDISWPSPEFPQYIAGIVLSERGAPTAYRVFRVDTSGQYTDPEDIQAASFLHYFDPFRVDQMRGVTDFHAALRSFRMLKEILEAELVGVRHSSQQVALVFNERGVANTRNTFTGAGAMVNPSGNMPQTETSEIGTIQYFKNGDKVETMPSRPSSAFSGYVAEVKTEMALGLGSYPVGVLWGMSDYKGPSVRAELAAADRCDDRNRRILEHRVLRKCAEIYILNEIANGDLKPPARKSGETFAEAIVRATRGSFRFPRRHTIDAGRESQARLAELSMGAISPQEIAAEDGKDAYVRADEKADFAAYCRDLAKKHDVSEASIYLPAGQQLPNTPAMAAAVGPKAGEDAAAAQADSVPKAEPAAPSTEAPAEKTPTAAELIAGPRANRANRLSAASANHSRIAALRRKTGDAAHKADEINRIFTKLK